MKKLVRVQRLLEGAGSLWDFADQYLEVKLASDGSMPGWYRLQGARSVEAPEDGSRVEVLHLGFLDSHQHLSWQAKQKQQIDLSGTTSFASMASRFEGVSGEDGILKAWGWAESNFGVSLEDFSIEAPLWLPTHIPILLSRVCGHSALINGAMKNLLQDPSLPDLVQEEELFKILDRLEEIQKPSWSSSLLDLQQDRIRQGYSGLGEMSLSFSDLQEWKSLAARGELLLDVQGVLTEDLTKHPDLAPLRFENRLGEGPLGKKASFHLAHWKTYLDGSFGSRTAWLRAPYEDADTYGKRIYQDSTLFRLASTALDRGFRLSFHCIGDAALDQALRVGMRFKEQMQSHASTSPWPGTAPIAHRLEHLMLLHEDQVEQLSAQNCWSLNLQPLHLKADLDFIEKRLGSLRLKEHAYRLATLKGFPIALGSDAPVVATDPLSTLQAACGSMMPGENLSMDAAIWWMSTGSRLALGMDPGKISIGSSVYLSGGDKSLSPELHHQA